MDRRFSLYLSGGVSPSFLIGNKTYLIQPSNGDMDLIGKLSNVNQMNYAAITGIAVNYRLFKRLSLFAEPSTRYSFRPVVKNYEGKRYPFNFVIYAGLNLSF